MGRGNAFSAFYFNPGETPNPKFLAYGTGTVRYRIVSYGTVLTYSTVQYGTVPYVGTVATIKLLFRVLCACEPSVLSIHIGISLT